jgi:redox-sensitive bicupin YhaK (pirin superfamily)
MRIVHEVIEPQMVIEGAGVLLRRSFGPSRSNAFDPFLLFDHFAFNDPIEGPIVGVPMHPHRGIETVTYMLEGSVRHRDSLGNAGVIGPGDVQWMTSGRGIMHEEMPRRGPSGVVKGFQLWVNLPAALKMGAPRYQEISADGLPVVEKGGARVRLVAGAFGDAAGPVTEIAARPVYSEIALAPEARIDLPVPEGHTAVAYVFEGAAAFGPDNPSTALRAGAPEYVPAVRMTVLGDGDGVTVRGHPELGARFMLMAGAPIREAIVPYGPFVMNTEDEIRQALADLRAGTFVAN